MMGFILLVVGVTIWWDAHLFKRILPGPRAALQARMGDGSKGVVALLLVFGIILMVIGYRSADYVEVYTPPSWGQHLNNLLMLIAVILFGMGSSKGRLRSLLRHPMLTGFMVWALAHLLVRGDLASVILFGGLGIWAPMTMLLINAKEPAWQRPAPGSPAGDVRLLIISLVVYAVIGLIHGWLGPWPFPG